MKVAPNKTVSKREIMLELNSPFSIAWWVHVTETPEETNRIVLRKGMPLGSKEATPKGGHTPPISRAGASAR